MASITQIKPNGQRMPLAFALQSRPEFERHTDNSPLGRINLAAQVLTEMVAFSTPKNDRAPLVAQLIGSWMRPETPLTVRQLLSRPTPQAEAFLKHCLDWDRVKRDLAQLLNRSQISLDDLDAIMLWLKGEEVRLHPITQERREQVEAQQESATIRRIVRCKEVVKRCG